MICLENNNNINNNNMKILPVLPLAGSLSQRQFLPIYIVLVVIKTLDMNRYVCIKTYLYILPEISAHHLQLKCIDGHCFSVPSLHRKYLVSSPAAHALNVREGVWHTKSTFLELENKIRLSNHITVFCDVMCDVYFLTWRITV